MRILRLTKIILICTVVLAGCISLSACSDKKKPDAGTKTSNASITAAPSDNTMVTAAPTPTITEFPGPIGVTPVPVTWEETDIEDKTMYANLTDGYLSIRKGPGLNADGTAIFDLVGKLTDGMPVNVTATVTLADTTWYRLSDGFYVCGLNGAKTYLSDTPPTPTP